MAVHLSLDGTWRECRAKVRACPLALHQELSLEEAALLPTTFIAQLLQAIDPGELDEDGYRTWRDKSTKIHRDYDLPAIIDPDGSMEWYKHGRLHREHDRAAVITAAGYQAWWQNGIRHRAGDLPAIIWTHGTKQWWVHGVKSRTVKGED